MKIKFYKEDECSWSAIAENVELDGWHYDELYWADINKMHDGVYNVQWQDNYSEKHPFKELGDAQQYVVLTYHKHKAHENGRKYQLDEE